jgi:hypothetical protein
MHVDLSASVSHGGSVWGSVHGSVQVVCMVVCMGFDIPERPPTTYNKSPIVAQLHPARGTRIDVR